MALGYSSPWIILLYAFKAAGKQTFFRQTISPQYCEHIIIFQTVKLCKLERERETKRLSGNEYDTIS